MKKDCQCIDGQAIEILQFWFGGDQQVNYRTKWFPEGSSEQQALIDLEITNKYEQLLEAALRKELIHWQSYRTSCMALIILLDQFSRHIYRHYQEPPSSPKRIATDTMALEVANYFHSFHDVVKDLPMAEYVFSLMPLRHNPSIDHLQSILHLLKEKEESSIKGDELLQRFRKQTTRRLQHLQDRAKLEATDDILERHFFQADETNIMKDGLVVATEMFLKKNLPLVPYRNSATDKTSNGKTVIRNIVMISLSGGVDSMVISKILALIRDGKKVPIDEIVAIHIDYANRPESNREAAYVAEWSQSLGIHCRIRVVNEVTRGITDRDLYEKISRTIRYSFYQECIDAALRGEFSSPTTTATSVSASGVKDQNIEYRVSGILFGHHIGDVQENVISNVMRGSSPLDLSGMTETSITNNVTVWRPLLSHTKEEIYAFAHQYGVPYFKDSTPSWSTRGKLRNQLIPLLVEIYGEGCLRNLSNLAMESDQTQILVHTNLYQPFLDAVRRSRCGLAVNIVPFRQQPSCFWKEILKQLMHSMSMSMIREKAVNTFVERLQRVTLSQLQKQKQKQKKKASATEEEEEEVMLVPAGWLELRKGYHTYLNEVNDLIVLREGVLRKNLVVYNPATTKNQFMQSKEKKLKQQQHHYQSNVEEVTPMVTSDRVGSITQLESGMRLVMFTCPETMFVISSKVYYHITEGGPVSELSRLSLEEKADSQSEPSRHCEIINHQIEYNEEQLQALSRFDYDFTQEKETVPSSLFPSVQILHYGPWKITIQALRIISANDPNLILPETNNQKPKLLRTVEDILQDEFSYEIYWPFKPPMQSMTSTEASIHCDLIFLKDFVQLFEQFIQEHRPHSTTEGPAPSFTEYYSLANHFYHEETSLFPDILHALSFDMKAMELRYRDGLPLLIPAYFQPVTKGGNESLKRSLTNHPLFFQEWEDDKFYIQLRFHYQFIAGL